MLHLLKKTAKKETKFKTNPVSITFAIPSFVRIIFLTVNPTIVDNELKCIVHKTTITPLVVGRVTINQLLLRKWDQTTSFDLVNTFYSSNCRERPATPYENSNYLTECIAVKILDYLLKWRQICLRYFHNSTNLSCTRTFLSFHA